MTLEIGGELTIVHDIFGIGGNYIFRKGQKVTIRDIWKTDGKWSNLYNYWQPERINGVKLHEESGIWFLDTFEETKTQK